jgi:hypothetical protein
VDGVTNVKIIYYDNLNSKHALNSEYIHSLRFIQASNHIVAPPSIPRPKFTMHHQSAMQHPFWLNPDGIRSKAIRVACICIVMTVAVSSLSKQGHLNPRMLVLSAFEECGVVVFLISFVVVAVVCVPHTFL